MSDTFLTPDEIAELTGRSFASRQIEALRAMGVPFWVNAVGRPVVARAAIQAQTSRPVIDRPWTPRPLRA